MPRKLHIGGKDKLEGWEILNAVPGPDVDHECNANDLSRFEDATFSELYASHVLEHLDYMGELEQTLKEWYRVLEPGGTIYISVPDLDVLASLFLDRQNNDINQRFLIMRMIFGGHEDEFDYHLSGLTPDFLASFLDQAGFVDLRQVDDFGLFNDASRVLHNNVLISANMVAKKPPATP